MFKRGQAAMEFLMTYGWAILVVLVVIGALAYFGILNPQTLLPERCELQMGLHCKDYLISTDANNNGEIRLTIENGRGNDIVVTKVNATSQEFNGSCVNQTSTDILNGESAEFVLTGCKIPAKYKGKSAKHKWEVQIEWHSLGSSTAYTHTAGGQIMARIE